MRGATFHSVECMVTMCERDLEQMMRRMAELKGKLKTLELGMVCASRDAHTTRTGAREAGARVPINLNSINIKGGGGYDEKVADATARAPGISLGFMFRNLPQAIPHHFALWWWRSMKERFFGKAFPMQEETAAEEWESTCRGMRDLIFDK